MVDENQPMQLSNKSTANSSESSTFTKEISEQSTPLYEDTDINNQRSRSSSYPAQKTIAEIIIELLKNVKKPMTVPEIYEAIIRDNLHQFNARNPKAVVYTVVSLLYKQTEERRKDGKDIP